MLNELWVAIPETNSMMFVSNFGNVYSLYSKNYRKPYPDTKGYLMIDYTDSTNKRITKKIHRLVAELFIHKSNENLIVNHIDGNKQNNHVNNLEWVTHKANTQHMLLHGLKKKFPNNLPHKAKRVLCVELDKVFESMCDASKITGVPQANISKVCRGVRNTAGGYTWKYIDKGEN